MFLFFATPALGGAERVHAQIVATVADYHPVVMFTEPPRKAELLPLYQQHARPMFLHPLRRSRLREYFNEARIAAEINRARDPVVLGAFSHFFYALLPRLRSHVRCVDLIHNFGVQFETFSLPYAQRLDARVVLSDRIKTDLVALYDAFGIARDCERRIRVIPNAVPVPPDAPRKPDGPLRILYVGRAGPEKRPHLVVAIAAELAARGVQADTTMVGVTDSDLPRDLRQHCSAVGVVTDRQRLDELYDAAHVVLLTSSREGLPMAMLEGMARCAVPVVTAVGAIPEHVNDGVNGVLLPAGPEQAVVTQAADAIGRLASHRGALAAMGQAAREHVMRQCNEEAFRSGWRSVLLGGDDA